MAWCRGATETTIACKHCGFENFHKAVVCSMCSEPIGSAGGDDTKARAETTMGSTLAQTLESSDNVPLSRRLKRARCVTCGPSHTTVQWHAGHDYRLRCVY